MAAILNFWIGTKKLNFCRGLSNEHPCNVCFDLLYWFQRRTSFNIFPQGPMLKLCPLMVAILNFQSAHKNHNFCRGPSNDHSYNVCFELVYLFQRRKFFNIFPQGPMVKLCPLVAAILNFRHKKHNFCRSLCNVYFELVYWFQRTNFLNIFPQGPLLKLCPLMAATLNFQSAQKK